jgi:two-component system NtrC family sensor kinase
MNPRATLRFRRATAALAIAWALLAFAVGLHGQLVASRFPATPFTWSAAAGHVVIHTLTPSAAAAGLEARDRLIMVDGEPVGWWFRSPHRLASGVANTYTVLKPDGRQISAALEPVPPDIQTFLPQRVLDLAIPLVGVVYLAIGVGVWRLKRDRPEAWALLLFCGVVAAQLFLAGSHAAIAVVLNLMTIPFIGATAFHLFTSYPMEPGWIVRHPEIRAIPYALATLLAAFVVLEPYLGVPAGITAPIGTFFTVDLSLVCIGVLFYERWNRWRDAAVDRADVMLAGGALSFLPVIGLLMVHYFFGTPFSWYVALLGFFMFPAAVGYGIVRQQLFEIRMIAKSSAAYGAATLAITGLFAFLITFTDALVGRFDVDARSPVVSVALLFFAILLFNPLRVRMQRLVDRFFDRDRAAYRLAVREISEAMVSMLSVKEIVDRILIAATDTMGVEGAMVLLLDEKNEVLRPEAFRGGWDEEAASAAFPSGHPLCRQLWMRRTSLSRGDFDEEEDPEVREACRDVFDTLDAELLVPILFGVDLLGVIAVGRKLSGERLGVDERELLRTLANQSSIAIENARAFDEIAKLNETLEGRVEDRTRELRDTQAQLVQSEKMRSLGQLVAGVAHELNNPIGFVHANLQLLDEYVEKLMRPGLDPENRERIREAIGKLLSRSREGTERVKQIVEDLRTFSRTGQTELLEVCVNDELDRTLVLIEPRLKDGIRVVREYGEVPPLRCFAGQLNQVFMNLLMNACDALEGKGEIAIRTRPVEGGVRIEIEDDGPGMPPEVKTRIFDPFFTTKDVGKGTGLGLYISHGIIERHGGSMWVESEPQQGSTFVIELPLQAPVEEAQ